MFFFLILKVFQITLITVVKGELENKMIIAQRIAYMYLVAKLTVYLWPNHKIISLECCIIGINSNSPTSYIIALYISLNTVADCIFVTVGLPNCLMYFDQLISSFPFTSVYNSRVCYFSCWFLKLRNKFYYVGLPGLGLAGGWDLGFGFL